MLSQKLSKSKAGSGCRQATRRLCEPHAISITRSEMPSVVRRKTSLTMRQRLTPEIVCSTTTRALETSVLMNFSLTLNSWPLGFFGVAWSGCLLAHTPESPGLGRAWRCVDTRSARHPWPSYRGLCPPRLGSDTRPASCWHGRGGGFCRCALASCRCSAAFVWRDLVDAGGGVRSRPSSGRDRQRMPEPWSPHDARRARGPPRGCARPVARLAGADESSRWLGVDSPQSASRASFAGGWSSDRRG